MTKRTTTLAWALAGLLLMVSAPAPPALAQASEQQQYQQRLRQLFTQLDRNGDGRLDRREASRNAFLERHFDRLDQGGKGYLLPSDLR
jgi:Ca2+-binding EF-hand superfamily protein